LEVNRHRRIGGRGAVIGNPVGEGKPERPPKIAAKPSSGV
jgi:hypothetical protein